MLQNCNKQDELNIEHAHDPFRENITDDIMHQKFHNFNEYKNMNIVENDTNKILN